MPFLVLECPLLLSENTSKKINTVSLNSLIGKGVKKSRSYTGEKEIPVVTSYLPSIGVIGGNPEASKYSW